MQKMKRDLIIAVPVKSSAMSTAPPMSVPTSTIALTSQTLSYGLKIANLGWKAACQQDPALRKGLNIVEGHVVYHAVAESLGLPYKEI